MPNTHTDHTDRTPPAGPGIHTEMCIDPALDWNGRSAGPVAVWCAATLSVLGNSESSVQTRPDGTIALRFDGVDFRAQHVGGVSRWWRLFAVEVAS